MVNVASPSPFNLHNRDVSVDASASPHPRSHSPEDKQVYYHSRIFFDVYPNRNSARNRKRRPYPSTGADLGEAESSDEVGGNDAGRSPITEQPAFWPIPIINARTIGFAESSTRGRTVDRVPQLSDRPSSTTGTGLGSASVQSPDGDNAPQKPVRNILKFAHGLLNSAFYRLRLQASSLSLIGLLSSAGRVHEYYGCIAPYVLGPVLSRLLHHLASFTRAIHWIISQCSGRPRPPRLHPPPLLCQRTRTLASSHSHR